MSVLHILRADFGASHTAGYRSFQIVTRSKFKIAVFGRSNASSLESGFVQPFPGYRYFALLHKVLRKYGILPKWFNWLDKWLYERSAKKVILKHQVIHFFNHSADLIKFALSVNKVVLIEAYTHPYTIKKLFDSGLRMDYEEHLINDGQTKSYELSSHIIAPSEWVAESLRDSGIPSEKISLCLYGVEPQKSRLFKERHKKLLKFMFAGALKITKGIVDLFEAWDLLPVAAHNLIQLNLYGRSYNTTAGRLSQMCQRHENIKYWGFIKNMKDQYIDNDVYILPSYFEGSSKTILEAMSFGLPVITTRNSGSIVRDGIEGYLISPGSPTELAHKIIHLIENYGIIEALGASAQKASRIQTWGKYVNRVDSVYSKYIE